MREIKFRAWNSKKPEMLLLGDLTDANWDIRFIFKHYKIMQYTGITDKNGFEIYEGDIIKRTSPTQGSSKYTVVTWRSGGTGIGFNLRASDGNQSKSFIVIGNIYENPDLLN